MAHPAKTLSVHSDEDASSAGSGIRSKQEAASELAGRIVIWKQRRDAAGRDTQVLEGRRAGATPELAGARQPVAFGAVPPGADSYSADFAALLESNAGPGDIARIKSPAFAASLSQRGGGTRRRSIALSTALACVLAAGAGAAVWSYGGYGTARAPELAGTLIVADRGNAAPKVVTPEVRTADLVELDAPAAIVKEGPASRPAQDTSVAPAPLYGGPLQAAIDGAPFRSSILGISTAALPVGSGALAPTGSAASAAAAPSAGASLEDTAALSPSSDAPRDSSLGSGQSDLQATTPSDGAGLPFSGGVDEPPGNAGHRESGRSDYVAAFTRDAFRSSATVAAIGGSLKPNASDEADSELDSAASASGPAAGEANGEAGAADGDSASAGANHDASSHGTSGQTADGSSKADNAGAGSGSASAGGSTSGNGAQASAGDTGQADGSSKADNPGNSGSGDGQSAGPDHAASSSGAPDGGDSDTGKTKSDQGKSDQAGKSKSSDSDGDAHGKQKGGDPHGGGKENGGQAKGHDKGGKDHGGKGHGKG
jgi:hypothetical protein